MAAIDDFAAAMREKRVEDAREIARSSLTPSQRATAHMAVRAMRMARTGEVNCTYGTGHRNVDNRNRRKHHKSR